MAILKVNDMTCQRLFQLTVMSKTFSLLFLNIYFHLSLICPSECTFGLNGRINEVNL